MKEQEQARAGALCRMEHPGARAAGGFAEAGGSGLLDCSSNAGAFAAERLYREKLPILDQEIFRGLRSMLPLGALTQIYATCIDQTCKRTQAMRAHAELGELDAVHGEAHAVHGSAAMLGITRLAVVAQHLQRQCEGVGGATAHAVASSIETTLSELTECCEMLAETLAREGLAL